MAISVHSLWSKREHSPIQQINFWKNSQKNHPNCLVELTIHFFHPLTSYGASCGNLGFSQNFHREQTIKLIVVNIR